MACVKNRNAAWPLATIVNCLLPFGEIVRHSGQPEGTLKKIEEKIRKFFTLKTDFLIYYGTKIFPFQLF